MPRATLIVHYVRSLAKSCNGILAAAAFFGHSGFVAVHTVDLFLMGGEAGASQGLSAGGAHEALRMPRLVLVIHTSCGNGLLAASALFGKLLLMAKAAVDVVVLCYETFGADWLLTLIAGETLVMPRVAFVFHILSACQDGLVAAMAARGILA